MGSSKMLDLRLIESDRSQVFLSLVCVESKPDQNQTGQSVI